jgi:hypothetical protein
MLLALPSFRHNAIVASVPRAAGVAVHDLTIDANRIGGGGPAGARVNGLQMSYARRFTVRRVDVRNCTGYAHIAVGNTRDFSEMAGDGTWEDCRAANCQVHFAQVYSENISLISCHSRDGEGDIACLAWFHPAIGARDILYLGGSARGLTSAGIEATASARDLERIRFIGCDVHVRGPGAALSTTAGMGKVSRLELIGTRLVSDGGTGARLYRTEAFATQSWISGAGAGLQLRDSSKAVAVGVEALGITDPVDGATAIGIDIDATSRASWTGGRIEGRGPAGKRVPLAGYVANVTLSGTTEVAGRARYFPVMESYGVRPIVHQGASTSSVTVALPNPVTDRERTHLSFTIRRNSDGYLADRVTGSWAFVDDRNVRVWLIGDATLATRAKLCVHFVEWGERS